jgi:hypothetical protein
MDLWRRCYRGRRNVAGGHDPVFRLRSWRSCRGRGSWRGGRIRWIGLIRRIGPICPICRCRGRRSRCRRGDVHCWRWRDGLPRWLVGGEAEGGLPPGTRGQENREQGDACQIGDFHFSNTPLRMKASVVGKGWLFVGKLVRWSPAFRLLRQAKAWTPTPVAWWVVRNLCVHIPCSAAGKSGFTRCDSCRNYSGVASSAGTEQENCNGGFQTRRIIRRVATP